MIVYGRNPVREALRGKRRVQRVFATERAAQEVWLGGLETVIAEPWELEQVLWAAARPQAWQQEAARRRVRALRRRTRGRVVLVAVVTVVPRLPDPVAAERLASGVDGGGGLAALRLEDPDRGVGLASAPRRQRPHVHRVRPGQPVIVDVFGDSVAWSLVANLPPHRLLDLRDRTLLGCGVTLTAPYRYFGHTYPTTWRSCRPWVQLWRLAVARDDPDIALIMVGRWETMDQWNRLFLDELRAIVEGGARAEAAGE